MFSCPCFEHPQSIFPPNMSDQVSHSYNTWGEITLSMYPTLNIYGFRQGHGLWNQKLQTFAELKLLSASSWTLFWVMTVVFYFNFASLHRGVFLLSLDVIRTQFHKTANYVPSDRRYWNLIMEKMAKISETILLYFGVAEWNNRIGPNFEVN